MINNKTQYSIYTYNSPSFIRRTIHKLRLNRSIKILKFQSANNILNYGAGDLSKSRYNRHINVNLLNN